MSAETLDTRCEATSRGKRCAEEPDNRGSGNLNLNDYCEACGKNLCQSHMAKHRCRNKKPVVRAERGPGAAERARIQAAAVQVPSETEGDKWHRRAMRLRDALESAHLSLGAALDESRGAPQLRSMVVIVRVEIMKSLKDPT